MVPARPNAINQNPLQEFCLDLKRVQTNLNRSELKKCHQTNFQHCRRMRYDDFLRHFNCTCCKDCEVSRNMVFCIRFSCQNPPYIYTRGGSIPTESERDSRLNLNYGLRVGFRTLTIVYIYSDTQIV